MVVNNSAFFQQARGLKNESQTQGYCGNSPVRRMHRMGQR